MRTSNILSVEPVKCVIRVFLSFMTLFYLLWAIFHDESSTPSPIKFEIAVVMIAVAITCNIGLFLLLRSRGAKFKKITALLLFMAAFFNFFMFVSIAHNPFQFLEEVQWYVLRKILAYGPVLFTLAMSVFVLRYEE